MEFDDLDDFSDDDEINYWEVLENADQSTLGVKMIEIMAKDKDGEMIQSFMVNHHDAILKQYVKALHNLNDKAIKMSFHEFGSRIFVIMTSNDKYLTGEKKRDKVELKPKSLKLQEELDDIYTDENITSAIEELGVFTKGEKEEDEDNEC